MMRIRAVIGSESDPKVDPLQITQAFEQPSKRPLRGDAARPQNQQPDA
jgi:hypothetical protein